MTSEEMQHGAAEVVEAIDNESLIDEKTGWNRLMVEQMARDIKIAHEINPKGWMTSVYLGRPSLNFGNTTFVTSGKNASIRLVIDRNALAPEYLDMFESLRTGEEFKSNPTFSLVEMPLQSTSSALAMFADAHAAAIRRTLPFWKINLRWRWHQEGAREEIARIAGRDIPQPGYINELAALREVTPSSPISAMYSQVMVDQMATSILAAHALGDTCWSVFETGKRIALNVGQEIVGGSAKPGMYDFVVDRELLTPEQLAWSLQYPKPKPTNEYPSLLFLQLPDDGASDFLPDLQDSYRSALAKLTTVFKKATLWKSHTEYFRKQVEQVSGLGIPEPGYMQELRELQSLSGSETSVLEHVEGRRYWRFG